MGKKTEEPVKTRSTFVSAEGAEDTSSKPIDLPQASTAFTGSDAAKDSWPDPGIAAKTVAAVPAFNTLANALDNPRLAGVSEPSTKSTLRRSWEVASEFGADQHDLHEWSESTPEQLEAALDQMTVIGIRDLIQATTEIQRGHVERAASNAILRERIAAALARAATAV